MRTWARTAVFAAVVAAATSLPAQSDPAVGEREAALRNLLVHDCGSCHGLTMKGGLGPPLLPADLAGKPDEGLIDTILEGRHGTPMPPWGTELTAEEAAWIVRILREGVAP